MTFVISILPSYLRVHAFVLNLVPAVPPKRLIRFSQPLNVYLLWYENVHVVLNFDSFIFDRVTTLWTRNYFQIKELYPHSSWTLFRFVQNFACFLALIRRCACAFGFLFDQFSWHFKYNSRF